MIERRLTPNDAALRRRIKELSVHVTCGRLRGPLPRVHPESPIHWQSCRCEDEPQTWPGCDVSREKDLCIVCVRATAGGTSRWSWLACEDCRSVNAALGKAWGRAPLALGRHSIMNGISVQGGQSPEVTAAQIERLARFARDQRQLDDWQAAEFRRLASGFDPQADVALSEWQRRWPPGREASRDAVSRIVGLPAEEA